MHNLSKVIRDLPYGPQRGMTLDLIQPWETPAEPSTIYPTVLFVQGSAWTTPDRDYQLPQLCELSRNGFVVATIGHRDASKHPGDCFPAFLEDTLTALNFLVDNAETYHVDRRRIGLWGTSSGANAALLAAIKPLDNVDLKTTIRYIVSCFAPTDLPELIRTSTPSSRFRTDCWDPVMAVIGADHGNITSEALRRACAMSPYLQIQAGREYPPILFLHGTADELIPCSQSEKTYRKLCEYGYDTEMIPIPHGDHDEQFWTQDVLNTISRYIEQRSC